MREKQRYFILSAALFLVVIYDFCLHAIIAKITILKEQSTEQLVYLYNDIHHDQVDKREEQLQWAHLVFNQLVDADIYLEIPENQAYNHYLASTRNQPAINFIQGLAHLTTSDTCNIYYADTRYFLYDILHMCSTLTHATSDPQWDSIVKTLPFFDIEFNCQAHKSLILQQFFKHIIERCFLVNKRIVHVLSYAHASIKKELIILHRKLDSCIQALHQAQEVILTCIDSQMPYVKALQTYLARVKNKNVDPVYKTLSNLYHTLLPLCSPLSTDSISLTLFDITLLYDILTCPKTKIIIYAGSLHCKRVQDFLQFRNYRILCDTPINYTHRTFKTFNALYQHLLREFHTQSAENYVKFNEYFKNRLEQKLTYLSFPLFALCLLPSQELKHVDSNYKNRGIFRSLLDIFLHSEI